MVAVYQPLSDGSAETMAARVPAPSQLKSHTLRPPRSSSLTAPVARSTRHSRRRPGGPDTTTGSGGSVSAAAIVTAFSDPAVSRPRSAASTRSEPPSGAQAISSMDPAGSASGLTAPEAASTR